MSTARPGNSLPTLAACCLWLSALEFLIPKPLPFLRIGLANLPLLLALNAGSEGSRFGAKQFFLLALLKVLGQALIAGSLFSYVFVLSLAGSAASCLVMFPLRRLVTAKYLSLAGIGMAGAFVSNAVQLSLAGALFFGAGARYLAPPFLVAGVVTGFALGLFAETFAARSRWFQALSPSDSFRGSELSAPVSDIPPPVKGAHALFVIGMSLTVVFVFTPSTAARAVQFGVYTMLAFAAGRRLKIVPTIAAAAAVILCNLLVPYGRVLYNLGPFPLTEGALLAGIRRAVTVEGLFMLSAVFVRPGLALPGRFGALMARTLELFGRLQTQKITLKKGKLIKALDEVLFNVSRLSGDV